MASDGVGSVWNAGNWHWEEKNFDVWAKEFLTTNFNSIIAQNGVITAEVVETKDLKGHASINIRKGKKVVVFEYNVKLNWEAFLNDDDSKKFKGELVIPEIFHDDVDDDYEITVTTTDQHPTAQHGKELMRTEGKKIVRKIFKDFADRLKSIDGGDELVEEDKKRRAEEMQRAQEAAESKGAEKERIAAAAREAEAARKMEEAARAAMAPQPVKDDKPEGQGSVWNQGSYHWEEKSFGAWAKDSLKARLVDREVEVPSCTLKYVEVPKLDGDAAVSIRRGKKLLFFEFDMKIKWEGTMYDGDGNTAASAAGEVVIREWDQDTDVMEELELDVTMEDTDSGAERIKEHMRREGVADIRAQLAEFLEELRTKG